MKLKSILFLFGFCVPLGTSLVLATSEFSLNNQYLYLSDLLIVLLAIAALLHVKQENSASTWQAWLLLSLVLGSEIGIILLPRETYTWYLGLKILEFAGLTLILQGLLVDRLLFKTIALGLVAGALFQVVLAALQFYVQHSLGFHVLGEPHIAVNIPGIAKIDLETGKAIRAYGTFSHPNSLSAFLVVAYGTALYLYNDAKKNLSWYLLAIGLLVFGVFLTFSRAALGAFVLLNAIFIYLLHMKLRIGDPVKKALGTIIASIGITVILLFPYLIARTQIAPTSFNRTLYNQTALGIIKERPLGVGVGNGLSEMKKRLPITEDWQVQPPHNFFLEVSLETGIPGLILIVSLFVYLFRILIRNIRKGESTLINIYLFSAFTTVIALMFFDHYFYTVQQTQLILAILIGMILAQNKTPRLLS